MIKCPSCGEENPPKFRLWGYCGAPLAAAAVAALPAHEVRKTVTLVFTDLKDSTVLGATLDSEALHEVSAATRNWPLCSRPGTPRVQRSGRNRSPSSATPALASRAWCGS